MTSYTFMSYRAKCPEWDVEISIQLKYRYVDGLETPFHAEYAGAKCPILENIKLPEHKKNKEYGLFRFCKLDHCPLVFQKYPNIIDTRLPFFFSPPETQNT